MNRYKVVYIICLKRASPAVTGQLFFFISPSCGILVRSSSPDTRIIFRTLSNTSNETFF